MMQKSALELERKQVIIPPEDWKLQTANYFASEAFQAA